MFKVAILEMDSLSWFLCLYSLRLISRMTDLLISVYGFGFGFVFVFAEQMHFDGFL